MSSVPSRDISLTDADYKLSEALPPVQNVVNVMRMAIRAIDANPLKAYILFKKLAKLMESVCELLKPQANAIYEDEHPEGEVFEYEGCTIKSYTKPAAYTFTKKVAEMEAEVKSLQARLKATKELEIAEGKARIKPAKDADNQTIFTVTVGE